ncbi:hypothetical protein BD410DRAFT_899186 [Rickenella mellea]|uniref:Galactose-binding like protein n=1 Tax=Rickenella mellea TaxID=50990 RepID=A0A4Y7Q0R7_9AGAM|nr:hypothetical protein BD410DRAFT_899186 [Rickenella mellea]
MADSEMKSLTGDARIRRVCFSKVSSTLDKSVGKKFLIDGNPDTCWTSQQGLPQYIHFTFDSPVVPKTISITFQGGFVGTRCTIDVVPMLAEAEPKLQTLTHIFPEDVNRKQTFELPDCTATEQLKIVFETSSDLFGRVTIYDLQVDGFHA